MSPRPSLLALSLLAVLTSAPAWATLHVDGNPSVKFLAEGTPGALSFTGTTDEISVSEDDRYLVLSVPMETVQTGVALRDDHMNHRYVEVDRFPDATLRVPRELLDFPEDKGKTTRGTAPGLFEVHGIERPVDVDWSIKRTARGWMVKGDFDIDATQHGIQIESYLGITVQPEMTVQARFELADDDGL